MADENNQEWEMSFDFDAPQEGILLDKHYILETGNGQFITLTEEEFREYQTLLLSLEGKKHLLS